MANQPTSGPAGNGENFIMSEWVREGRGATCDSPHLTNSIDTIALELHRGVLPGTCVCTASKQYIFCRVHSCESILSYYTVRLLLLLRGVKRCGLTGEGGKGEGGNGQ